MLNCCCSWVLCVTKKATDCRDMVWNFVCPSFCQGNGKSGVSVVCIIHNQEKIMDWNIWHSKFPICPCNPKGCCKVGAVIRRKPFRRAASGWRGRTGWQHRESTPSELFLRNSVIFQGQFLQPTSIHTGCAFVVYSQNLNFPIICLKKSHKSS